VNSKAFSSVEIKDADKGQVTAVFSTFDVVDHDNDVTVKGAIKDGASVCISAYNHASWKGALPVGTGRIRVAGNEATLEGQFFMNTSHGRDTFETVKALAAEGLGEWSYGFDVVDSEHGSHEGKSVRILKQLNIHEVSPVLRGAGLETRTLATKSLNDEISEAVDAVEVAVKSAERVVALRAEKAKELSKVNAESLVGLRENLKKLDGLLATQDEEKETTPDDEISREWLRSIASEL